MAHKITDHAVIRYLERIFENRNWTAQDYLHAKQCLISELQKSIFMCQHNRKIKRRFNDAVFVVKNGQVLTVEKFN